MRGDESALHSTGNDIGYEEGGLVSIYPYLYLYLYVYVYLYLYYIYI